MKEGEKMSIGRCVCQKCGKPTPTLGYCQDCLSELNAIEVCKFTSDEIDEAIEGLDGLQRIIVPLLKKQSPDMAEKDIQQFKRHIMMAKHALITMGTFFGIR